MHAKLVLTIGAALLTGCLIAATVSAHAAERTIAGGETFSTMTLWAESDSQGNTIYTQLDILSGATLNSQGAPQYCQCTTVTLSRTVIDPAGKIIFTADSFFGRTFTADPVFQVEKHLERATLAPIAVAPCPFCGGTPYTIQAAWVSTGELAPTDTTFKQIAWLPTDHYQVVLRGEADSREASATGLLNGQPIGAASVTATLQSNASLTASIGNVDPFGTLHPDYDAPVVDLGNKFVRGGKGTIAQATWTESANGNTESITLLVLDGVGSIGRTTAFFDGTRIALFRVGLDQYGNLMAFDYGFASTSETVFRAAQSLERARLFPTAVTICDFAAERDANGNCIVGDAVQVQAEWAGTGKPTKERFRFSQVTACDDSLCSTTDQHRAYKVKVTGAGEFRDATATGSLNGVDLGPSTTDIFGQSSYLTNIKEFAIQYGGTYPFEIFPVGLWQ